MSTGLGTIAQTFQRYRKYQSTMSELHALGDRELQDLGLSRSKFRELARRAAYER
ncbi:MAG: DUF1127 domain-containing protein [Pseudomonadota bacterium]